MSDVTGNDSLSFLNDVVDLDVFDKATVGYQITGTWVGTITWTASIDGVTFFALLPVNSAAATTTANANLWFNVNGLARIKLAMTAYTSGTAVINYVGNAEPLDGGAPTAGSSMNPGTTALALGKAEDAVHASGDVGVMMLGVRADNATAFTNADGDYSPLALSTTGAMGVMCKPTNAVQWTYTSHRLAASAATTNATNVKATGGNIYSLNVLNTNAAIRYLKLYNKATAPTVGTDAPIRTILLPPTSNTAIHLGINPLACSAGIGYALTAGAPDADVAAVGAGDVILDIQYF